MRLGRISLAVGVALLWVTSALAQSTPNLYNGQVPTAAQWNSYFAAKQNLLGYTPLNRAGDSMLGPLTLTAASAGNSGFNVGVGTTPTTPKDGDIWLTNSGVYYRVGGVSYGPVLTTLAIGVTDIAHGGTNATTAAGARSNLNVWGDSGTAYGDGNQTLLSTDRFAYTSAALTVARTWTMPAANALGHSYAVTIGDMAGGISGTNTLTLQRAGTDTVNGGTTAVALNSAYSGYSCTSDGTSKWVCLRIGAGSGTVTSVTCGTGLDGGTFSTTGTCSLSAARQTLPTTSSFTTGTAATYTTPANALWLEVYLRGGGGGGAGGGTAANDGTAGSATTFGTFTANGGGQGKAAGAPITGGTATGGTLNIAGAPGNNGGSSVNGTVGCAGGAGGGAGAGPGGTSSTGAGGAAVSSSGAGGGGGGQNSTATSNFCSSGGSQGGYVYAVITGTLAATYTYTVGGAGSGGAAGTNGSAGGNGAAGLVTVVAHYN